jgi:hypothetical protein
MSCLFCNAHPDTANRSIHPPRTCETSIFGSDKNRDARPKDVVGSAVDVKGYVMREMISINGAAFLSARLGKNNDVITTKVVGNVMMHELVRSQLVSIPSDDAKRM